MQYTGVVAKQELSIWVRMWLRDRALLRLSKWVLVWLPFGYRQIFVRELDTEIVC